MATGLVGGAPHDHSLDRPATERNAHHMTRCQPRPQIVRDTVMKQLQALCKGLFARRRLRLALMPMRPDRHKDRDFRETSLAVPRRPI